MLKFLGCKLFNKLDFQTLAPRTLPFSSFFMVEPSKFVVFSSTSKKKGPVPNKLAYEPLTPFGKCFAHISFIYLIYNEKFLH